MVDSAFFNIFLRFSLCFTLIIFSTQSYGQLKDTLVVSRGDVAPAADSASGKMLLTEIMVTGNRKTKDYIIRREIQIKEGDSVLLQNFEAQLIQARSQVYNTNLFDEVTLTAIRIDSTSFKLNVKLKERWYIYPSPQFQLIDRSFSEWIKVYNADLERVTYGAKYTQYNFTGRRDVIRISLLTGYARNIQFGYTNPYSNRKLTEGFGISTSFLQNREFAYRTKKNNQFQNYRAQGFVRTSFTAGASYFSRKGYFSSFSYGAGIAYIKLTDTAFSKHFSKEYYGSNSAAITFPEFSVSYVYSKTNNNNYPLTGRFLAYGINKRGIGFSAEKLNMVTSLASYNLYKSYGKNWYGKYTTAALLKLPFKQSFYNRRALGFGNLQLRGLDAYVVDGVAAAVATYTLRKKLGSFDMRFPIKNKFISKIPFTFYGKSYIDAGYAYANADVRASLNNKFLYTTGIGVDVLTFYDIVLGFDYSKNQLQAPGFFFRVVGSL